MSFDFDSITDSVGKSVNDISDQIASFSKTMDPTNTADTLKLQQMMAKYQVVVGAESAMINDVKQALQGIVQKM